MQSKKLNLTVVSASQGKFNNWTYEEFWYPLIVQMEKKGINLNDNLSSAFISINHNRKEYLNYRKKFPNNKKFLIRTEPISVYPLQYEQKIEDLYDFILTPGGTFDLFKNFSYRNYPYFYVENPFKYQAQNNNLSKMIKNRIEDKFYSKEKWDSRNILCSIVASNKISPLNDSNYELRRQVYDSLPDSKLSKFGQFWNFNLKDRVIIRLGMIKFSIKQRYGFNYFKTFNNFFLNLKQVNAIENKHKTLINSKYHLIIENSHNFVTEKIFDSIIDGAIPIYIGTDLGELGIPIKSYIKCEANINAINLLLSELKNRNSNTYREGALKFLSSGNLVKNFSGEEIYSQIIDEIINKLI